MPRGKSLTLCLIAMWLLSSTTPVMSEPLVSESEMMPRSECEETLTEMWLSFEDELMQREREEEASMRRRSAACEERVKAAAAEGAQAGAAEAARPLLVEIAGLKAECDILRRRLVPVVVGGILTGIVAGFVIGVVL